MNGLVTALRTLSLLPVPGKDSEDASRSLPWFAPVGAILGSILLLVAWSVQSLPPDAAAALVLAGGVWITRGFHIDGLADCADGFGGGYSRERVLEIMKDSASGVFGVLAVVLSLLLKWIALKHLFLSSNLLVIPVAYGISRALIVEQMVALPYARENGTAGPFMLGAKQLHRILALAFAALIGFALMGFTGLGFVLIGWLTARGVALYAKRLIGGVTGDVLGATSEIVETLILFLPILL